MGASMADIAKAAGASVTTVGRVLHGNGYVSADARARIEQAIKDLGYVPDRRARALRTRHSGLIGSLVVPIDNGLYRHINQSITRAASEAGREIVTMDVSPDGSDIRHVIRNLIGMHIDGLVITSCSCMQDELFTLLHDEGIPVVCVERTYPGTLSDSLTVTDREGFMDSVGKAIAMGHRRIAFIGAEPDKSVEKLRFEGYKDALSAAGIPVDPDLIRLTEGYAPRFGKAAAEALMDLKEPPTAVFTGADTLAAGVLQLLYRKGLRVPEDVSLIGYDNMVSASLAPAIDSVGLVLDDIGSAVIDLLVKRIDDPDRPYEDRPIHTMYVERGTLTPPVEH